MPNNPLQRGQRRLCISSRTGARVRQLGHTPYLSPQVAGKLGALRGRVTTDQDRGGLIAISSDARGTDTRLALTSTTPSVDVSAITRYHAPRLSPQFTSDLSRAHCCSAGMVPPGLLLWWLTVGRSLK